MRFFTLTMFAIFLHFSVDGIQRFWEQKTMEEPQFSSADMDTEDYEDWVLGKWKKAIRPKLCLSDTNEPICRCEKTGNRTDLLCAAQDLKTAEVILPAKFMPSVVHMEHNKIFFLMKNKILPGHQAKVLTLDLASNMISDIQPGAFDEFTQMQVLVLTHNKLDSEEISTDVFTPEMGASLHQLYLDYNFIEQLDDGVFDNLKSLTKLVLDGNRGIQLKAVIFTSALAKLQVLSLEKCGIKELSNDIFKNLTSLRALSLSGNPLSSIPLALKPLNSLTYLMMSDTNLEILAEGTLQNTVPGLEKLYMRKMKYLTAIESNAFKGLQQLKFADFGYSSRLRVIGNHLFGTEQPKNFSELGLQHCNLSTLSAELMQWNAVDSIKLNGNPFACDCKVQWLLKKDMLRKIAKGDEPTCKYPKALEGYSLYNANNLNDLCDPHTTSTGNFVVFLVFVVLASALIAFGVVYARRRYMTKYGGDMPIPRFIGVSSRRHPAEMGFNPVGSIFQDDEDSEEHEEVRMESTARGGQQPEYV